MADQPKKRREVKILLLDSNREDLDRLAHSVQEAGFRAVALSHFDVAPALYKAFLPHAVVVALRTTDLSRMDVVPRLRQLSAGTLSLFCILEEENAQARFHFLEKLHGCDVLIKPVDPRELIAKIKSFVRIKHSVEKVARNVGEQRLGIRDGQTGAHSLSFLQAMIAQEARRAERHGGTFSVLVSGLENFEQYKNAFGAEWVRRAIKHAVSILRHATRDCDMLARLDESRFAMLLPGTGSEGIPAIRSRLKICFQRSPFEFQGRWMKTPVLLGAASFPEVVGTAKLMLATACQDLRRWRETRRRSGSALTA
jgi:diguanylate cyclase (GGDEF)-like protein